jgi:hypothetical protein
LCACFHLLVGGEIVILLPEKQFAATPLEPALARALKYEKVAIGRAQ